MKCFEVLLMSKPKWPPISSYEIVKTSDEKYKTQLRLLVYLHTQLWYYVPTYYLAPLQTILQTMTIYNDNEYAYYLIAIRYVAENKYIQKFWKQTIAGDASLCYVIITLSYITLTLQIMLINITYLDVSVSNIPITPRHELFCVCPQRIRVCVTIQQRLWLVECMHRMIFVSLPHIVMLSVMMMTATGSPQTSIQILMIFQCYFKTKISNSHEHSKRQKTEKHNVTT